MYRDKYTLADTPIGYIHTTESVIGEFNFISLSLYLYAFYDDDTTLICGDAGNGNYEVLQSF